MSTVGGIRYIRAVSRLLSQANLVPRFHCHARHRKVKCVNQEPKIKRTSQQKDQQKDQTRE